MVTAHRPKVSGRYWYGNLPAPMILCTLFTKWGMFRSAVASSSFYCHVILFISLLAKEICAVFSLSSSFPTSDYQEEKKGRLQWKVCVKALPSVTTRPWPPERLRSTTTRGICTSWMGLFPSFSAWVRFNTWWQTGFMMYETQKHAETTHCERDVR